MSDLLGISFPKAPKNAFVDKQVIIIWHLVTCKIVFRVDFSLSTDLA